MTSDPAFYLPILVAGAFVAALVIGAVGFADALILNAVWLHIMEPAAAIPLVVTCAFFMHIAPIYKLRKTLDFSRLPPFLVFGVLAVPLGVWALGYISPDVFRNAIAMLLIVYGIWVLLRPNTAIGTTGGKVADSLVGFAGGFLGGFAGLSGLAPTIWVGLRGWAKNSQRGVYQPFVVIMHALGLLTFALGGLITQTTMRDLAWCLPAIVAGSWLGVQLYPYLNEVLFKRIILALILLSGISLLI